jgi:hypothetical protein
MPSTLMGLCVGDYFNSPVLEGPQEIYRRRKKVKAIKRSPVIQALQLIALFVSVWL